MAMMDPFGREITYLRASVTDRCDFRCFYCMAEDMTFLPKSDLLSLEELDRLYSAFIARGVRKLRLTGGEPLVRRNVIGLIGSLGRHLESGALRGADADDQRQPARAARGQPPGPPGVKRINVSLDTLDGERFAAITRWGRLDQVLEGIAAAKAAGLAVKINTVALRGLNDDEFDRLIGWCGEQGFDLTLIETMPLGEVDVDRSDHFLPLSMVRADLARRWTLVESGYRSGGPARYVEVAETGRSLGFINPPHPQFLRVLQPRAPDLHGHAVHVPGPGGRRRPAHPPARQRGQRAARRGDRRGDRPQAPGPRFHHRPRPHRAFRRPPHERDRRLVPAAAIGAEARAVTSASRRRRRE